VFGCGVLAGFLRAGCVVEVTVRDVSMVACLFVIGSLMMFSGSAVVSGSVFKMLRCLAMVVGRILGHVGLSFVERGLGNQTRA
jgi:hypothetical protein